MADTKTPDSRNSDSKMKGATNERLRSETNKAEGSQAVRHEHAKGEVSGQRQEKSAIGREQPFGGSQTGEPGRARDELGQSRGEFDKNRNEADKARSEFDKNREPTGER